MAAIYCGAPKVTEEEARKEKASLSFLEKEKVKQDLYGELTEAYDTQEFIAAKLQDLKIELDKIPGKDKVAYKEACEQGAEYTQDEGDLILFLRSENFRAKPAANRIVRYWLHRVELFGHDLAFRPLSCDSLFSVFDNEAYFQSEGVFHLLEGKDHTGRSLLFQNLGRNVIACKRDNILRELWCLCHESLKMTDSKDNKRGHIVMVCTAADVDIEKFNRKLQRKVIATVANIVPVKIAAVHWCHPVKNFICFVLPVLQKTMGRELRQRCLVHSGSETEVLEVLGKFGIGKDLLPADIGGNLVSRKANQKSETGQNGDKMKRKRPLEANQSMAAASRQRRVYLIDQLEKHVSNLKQTVTSLTNENVDLHRLLVEDPRQQQGLRDATTRNHGQGDIFSAAPP